MRVGVLGPLLIDAGAGPASIAGARLRGLLARLALDAGRPVRPEQLVQSLWADDEPADQANALQSLVSRLRRAVGNASLVASGPAGYQLAVPPDDVDALRFERLAAAGRRDLAAGRPEQAAGRLRTALDLWRGVALADVRDSPFAAAEADRLDRLRVLALEDRIEADLMLGAGPAVVDDLETLTAEHPFRERLQAQLLRALAASGRTAEALARYELLRSRLAEELGTDPGAGLQAVHLDLLHGRLPATPDSRPESRPESRPDDAPRPGDAPPPGDAPRPGGSVRPRGNLSASLTSFVGREGDVQTVGELLGSARLVTLVGPGGAGKTRLALEVGHHEETAPDGIWMVSLASVGRGDDVVRAVLDALHVRETGLIEQSSGRPPRERPGSGSLGEARVRLVETMAERQALLLLDNCEHLLDAVAALVEELLGRCPRLRVLATSREPLHIAGEMLHPVPPLTLPEPDSGVLQAGATAAVRLFADRAAAVRPDFVLDEATVAPTVEICRRLDGLPLAIELAAARLRTLPIDTVAARLDDRFRLLTGGSRTALPRHQTLRAVVAWSWDLLDDPERLLLERLAVLPGGFDETAATEIAATGEIAAADEIADLLSALVDKSLLQVVDTGPGGPRSRTPRYRMLETIREYGIERLGARGEIGAVRDRHARYFLRLAEAAEPLLRTSAQLAALATISADRDNLLAAIRWAAETGDADTAVRLGASLCWYWTLRGSHGEAVTWLDVALGVPGPSMPAAHAVAVCVQALSQAVNGHVLDAQGTLDRITAEIQGLDTSAHPLLGLVGPAAAVLSTDRDAGLASIRSLPAPGDPWTRAALQLMTGLQAENAGDPATAIPALEEALAGFQDLGERWGMATSLAALGGLAPLSGDVERALALQEEAARYSRELGAEDDAAQLELRTATLRSSLGETEKARATIENLLRRSDELNSAHGVAFGHLGLATVEADAGRPAQAHAHALEALHRIEAEPGAPPQIAALVLALLVQLDTEAGRLDQAARWLDRPAVTVVLSWDMPIASKVAVAASALELARSGPRAAARMLGVASALLGAQDRSDQQAALIARRVRAALGDQEYERLRSEGAAMPRQQARDLLAAVIAGADEAQARRR